MAPSPREQVYRASAVMLVVALALYASSYVLSPSVPYAAALGVLAVAVFAGVVTDHLHDQFGLVWLALGLAAVVVAVSGSPESLRTTSLGLVGAGVGGAFLWFVPVKTRAWGERLRERF